MMRAFLSALSFLGVACVGWLLSEIPFIRSSHDAIKCIVATADVKHDHVADWRVQLSARSEALNGLLGFDDILVVDAKDPLVPKLLKQIDASLLPTYEPESLLSQTPAEKCEYGYDTYLWLDLLTSYYADDHESAKALYRQAMLYESLKDDSRPGSFAFSAPVPGAEQDKNDLCFVRLGQVEHRPAGVFHKDTAIPFVKS